MMQKNHSRHHARTLSHLRIMTFGTHLKIIYQETVKDHVMMIRMNGMKRIRQRYYFRNPMYYVSNENDINLYLRMKFEVLKI